jgi:PAS domain S-box-containing protein
VSEHAELGAEDSPRDAEHELLRERLVRTEMELALLRERVTREARGPDRLRTEVLLRAAGVATFEAVIPERRMMVDDHFLAMIGCDREQFGDDAANYEALVHPEDRPRAAAAMRSHLAGETPFVEVEYRVRHRAGHDVWVLVRGAVVDRDEHGQPLRFCGTQLDVSERISARVERERLETQLQQSQKFESLGLLAGGVAHDFNNLLCGILGNVDLAALDLAEGHPAQQSLDEIRAAAHQATELCRQMLAYAGRERLVVAEVDLSRLVGSMEQLLRVSVSKKASMRLDLTAPLPKVQGDASQLRQVLLNLVLNASEALGDESGVISVRTGVEECQQEYLRATYLKDDLPGGQYVVVEVSDSGVGMDADTQSRLFDPFFSTKFLGRGLGLAAVIGILRAHGGTIKVYSEVGKGSVFKVFLPAVVVGAQPTVVPPVSRWTGSGRVLLADDEPSVRSVGARMLQRLGFEVLLAEDGREAVRKFEKHGESLVLVLLDMTMPHLDGAETFRELRRLRPDVKVVLTSGYTEAEATGRFSGKGLAGFVQKPFRLNALRVAVQNALE